MIGECAVALEAFSAGLSVPKPRRREIARDAVNTEAIGPVGGDGDVDDRVVKPQRTMDSPSLAEAGSSMMPPLSSLSPSSAAGAEHAVAFDAADGGLLDDHSVCRNLYAFGGEHNFDTCARIGRAADDLAHARAVIHLADAQFVGTRLRHRLFNLRDDEGFERGAMIDDFLDLQPDGGERLGDLIDAFLSCLESRAARRG